MAKSRGRDVLRSSTIKQPTWLRNVGKALDVFLSEEQGDDLEEPILYKLIEDAYRRNFDATIVNRNPPRRRKRPLLSSDNSNKSQNVEERSDINFNHAKDEEEPYTVTLIKSENQVKPDGDEGIKKTNSEYLQKMELEAQVQAVLGKLEKPTLCSRMLDKLGKLCDDKCCKYTARIYFKKPLTWYSATAKLDAGTMLRENYIGICAGIFIGFISYLVFASAFAHAPHVATLAACYMMMFAVFGIAFSADFRCVLINTLPYIVASRTRWMLMMIATTLVTTGPAINFMHNSGNFRNAIACVLGQVNANAELVAKITSAPLQIIRKNLGSFVDKINDKLHQARSALKELRETLRFSTNLFNEKSNWIKSVVEACGDEIAMKNQCLAFFNQLYFNCAASMQAVSFLCNFIRMFASQACKSVSVLNDICEKYANKLRSEVVAVSPVSEAELDESENAIKGYLGNENISIDIDEDATDLGLSSNFSAQTQVTVMIEERMDDMMNVMNRFKYFMQWMLVIWTLFTVIQLILQSAMYRRKWIKKPYFDNAHITPQFVAQERKALENGRPTALPLNYFEERRYVSLTACRWSKSERKAASKSIIFIILGMSALVLMIIADYAMYHVVNIAAPAFSTDFGEFTKSMSEGISDGGGGTKEEVAPQIDGNSSMADISRSFLQFANPLKNIAFSVDASICRPRASEPDHRKTILIFCVLAFTIFSTVVQVYVLRLRHLIMAWYYPTAAIRRAAWLRTYIRNHRGLFFRLFHRMRLKNVKNLKPKNKMKPFDKFIFFNPKLAKYLKLAGISRVFCAQCSSPGNPAKKEVFQENFTQCPRCGMFYCKLCQADLKGICMDCNVPLRTKSVEVDFEVWPSDEEYDDFYNRYFTRRKHDAYQLPRCPPSAMKSFQTHPVLPSGENIEVRQDLVEKLRIIAERRRALNTQGDVPEMEKIVPPRIIIPKKLPLSSPTGKKWKTSPPASSTETIKQKEVKQAQAGSNESLRPEVDTEKGVTRESTESEAQTDSKTLESFSGESTEILTSTSPDLKRGKKKYETKLIGDRSISEPSDLSASLPFGSSFSPPEEMDNEIEAFKTVTKFSSFSNDFSDIKPFSSNTDCYLNADFSSIGGLSSLNCPYSTTWINRKQWLESISQTKYGSNKSNAYCEMTPSATSPYIALKNELSKICAKSAPSDKIAVENVCTTAVKEAGVSLSSRSTKTLHFKESTSHRFSRNKSCSGTRKASKVMYQTGFGISNNVGENNYERLPTADESLHLYKLGCRDLKDVDRSLSLELSSNLTSQLPLMRTDCNTNSFTVLTAEPPLIFVHSKNSDSNQKSNNLKGNFDKVCLENESENANNLSEAEETEFTLHSKKEQRICSYLKTAEVDRKEEIEKTDSEKNC